MIYFVQEGGSGLVKIGWAKSLESFLCKFQSSKSWMAYEPKVLKTMEGTKDDEEILHRKFNHLWSRAEWFRLGEDLLAFIDQAEPLHDVRVGSRYATTLTPEETEYFLGMCDRRRLHPDSIYLRTVYYGKFQPGELARVTIRELFETAKTSDFPTDFMSDLFTFYADRSPDDRAVPISESRMRQIWSDWRPSKKTMSALIMTRPMTTTTEPKESEGKNE